MALSKKAFNSDQAPFWAMILLVAISLVFTYTKFPFHSHEIGDEPYYLQEASYLASYGLFNALSQGTSVIYSLLILAAAKIFFVSYLTAGRLLNVIFFCISCFYLLRCLKFFKDLNTNEKYITVLFFTSMYHLWLFKALPDIVSITFFWASLYRILSAKRNIDYVLSGILLFISFAIKPPTMFALPGVGLLILLRHKEVAGYMRWIRAALFSMAFIACFVLYQIPGYMVFHKLMLEDKNHSYSGVTRITAPTSWGEKNTYFEVYNVNHRKNKWAVSFAEVDSFKAQHPNIKLDIGYTEYITQHFGSWILKTTGKLFLDIPYAIHRGFFFSKWTVINKYVNNMLIIQSMAFVIMLSIYVYQRKFLKDNILLYFPALSFYVILCLYCIPQLESNWLYVAAPFLALPVSKTLNKYINYYVVIVLQLIFICLP